MSLSRKTLKAMGLTEEQVDTVIEGHTETVDDLKAKLRTAEEKADKADDLQKQLDDLKSKSGDDYKKKYEDEKKAFADYKASVEAEKTRNAKKDAVKAYFEEHGITGANLDIALRGSRDETDSIEMNDGKIKDTKALDDLISGAFKGLVVVESTEGAKVPNPNSGDPKPKVMSKSEIYKKDENGQYVLDASERQKELAKLLNQKGN